MAETTRPVLLERWQRLDPAERALLQVLAVADEPLNQTVLLGLCIRAGLARHDPATGKPPASLSPRLRRLRDAGLIGADNRISEQIVEVVVRALFADTETLITPAPPVQPAQLALPAASRGGKRPPPKPSQPPAVPLSQAIVAAVRSALPEPRGVHPFLGRDKATACHRTRRELRLALVGGEDRDLDLLIDTLRRHCQPAVPYSDPVIALVNNPFDPAWCASLPARRQALLIRRLLTHAFYALEPDQEPLALGLRPELRAALPADERLDLLYHLALRLILAGRTGEAQRLVDELSALTGGYTFGFGGWIALVEGRLAAALDLFAADLKELRRRQRKRTIFFTSHAAPFALLALLRAGDAASLDKARVHLNQALRTDRRFTVMDPALHAVEALLDNQGGLPAHTALAHLVPFVDDLGEHTGALAPLCVAMALFAVNGGLKKKEITRLSRYAERCGRAGFDWLALECAHLLCRADTATPARRATIDTLGRATNLQPLSAAIEIEEPWRKSLRALERAVAGADRHDGAADQARSRVVYLLHFSGSGQLTSISPLEQKLGAGGSWSKGRAIALQRLVSGERLVGLDEADQGLRAAVRQVDYGYGGPHYEFNLRLALPALVGHPRLFLADAPTTPVQVGRGEAEIQAVVKNGELVIRLLPEPTADERYVLVRETPGRFRVVAFTDTHHRLARILGGKGLILPEAASGEAARVLTTLASLVPVHSSLPGTTHAVATVPADPRPRVHLLPHGAGFRVEILVRPLDSGGPCQRPGEGAVNLMADVEGRRCMAVRDLDEEQRRAAALERSLPVLATLPELDGQWYADTAEEALQVLVELREPLERGEVLVAWPEGEKLRLGRSVSAADLSLRLGGGDRWFTVEGELRVDDERVLGMQQLLELVQATPHRFLPLGEGEFIALTRELRRRLEELAAYVERRGRKLTLHPLAALALDDLTGQVGHLDAAPGWHERLAEMRAALDRTETPPSTLKARLRDYQLQGFQWLARLAHLGFGACLADDMGLGKTVQALAVILHCADQGPTLVVAPTSVCANWLAEAGRFAPTLRLVPFGGADRQALLADLGPFDLVVTSYGLLHQEAELLSAVAWQTVVLDEAQAIKNSATRRSQAAMHLQAQFRLITTGTPIENHLGEFYTLFHFINPGLLGSRERFNERFAAPIERTNDREAGRRLKKLIQPFILRRLKSQVLEELPPRTEVLLEVELGPEETAFYEALRRQALERIDTEAGAGGHQRMRILAEITRLRQACCHPRLVLPESPLPGAKLALFAEVVGELLDNGHKALVFSQFVGHLALIRAFLDERAIPYRYLDGSTPPRQRQREVEAFQAGQGDLFLISLKAGGLGLNLTAADYVIHMDPWWNPAVEDQASDRAHRFGQQRPVTVYRLVTRNTIEEKIVRLHAEKRDLADSLLEGTDASGRISADDLLRLIREP